VSPPGRVLAIPPKRYERGIVTFLNDHEVEAILAASDGTSFLGRRDPALLLLAIQAGLRVSELTRLSSGDVVLGAGAHVRCVGKGRKERATPLTTTTAAVLGAWLKKQTGRARFQPGSYCARSSDSWGFRSATSRRPSGTSAPWPTTWPAYPLVPWGAPHRPATAEQAGEVVDILVSAGYLRAPEPPPCPDPQCPCPHHDPAPPEQTVPS
jgi:hypothetical protein